MHELFIWYLGESCVEKLRLLLHCFTALLYFAASYASFAETEREWVCTQCAGLRYSPGHREGKKPVDVFLAELVTRMNGLTRFPLSLSTL